MKTLTITIALLALAIAAGARPRINVGGGYYGHFVTHPGLTISAERVGIADQRAAAVVRAEVGAFHQPRFQSGIFVNSTIGLRRSFDSGLFLEEAIGIGAIGTAVASEGVYQVADGSVVAGTTRNPLELMPSIVLGIGYSFARDTDRPVQAWARPTLFWQFPHKRSSMYGLALQVGVTRTVRNR